MQRSSPANIGILAVELYFPSTYVDQAELEDFDKVPKGKYTIGLGQTRMASVSDREDVNSIALTAVSNLMKKNHIDPKTIGRMEVGTETLVDKSKSVKTHLMSLFKESGNHDIEGVTSTNACYGGTNALFNTINWLESRAYDGRYGLIVCCDIAVYAKGNARPTGGAGAVAMLLGPNAPLVFSECRSTYMNDVYDFYKPDPNSEYPIVDGKLSIEAYLTAVDYCYMLFKQKYKATYGIDLTLDTIDYSCFHSPFAKMVQKGFTRLCFNDILEKPENHREIYELMKEHKFSFDSRPLQTALLKYNEENWKNKCNVSLLLSKELGNIYTGSLYTGLLSLICNKDINLQDKSILMFSYGSGCSASMFTIRGVGDYSQIASTADFHQRLSERLRLKVEEYDRRMMLRETRFGKSNYKPETHIGEMFDGTYYLTHIDTQFRRHYDVKFSTHAIMPGRGSQMSPTSMNKTESRLSTLNSHLNKKNEGLTE